jgi:carboxymethylenebutenolidase
LAGAAPRAAPGRHGILPPVPETTFAARPGEARAYVAEPASRPPWPGVVVLHEAFGLNDDIRAKADRLAGRGYLAFAPDLYSTGRKPLCVLATFRALFRGRGEAFELIDAARAELAGRPDCTGRTGVIGFCMGGGFALLAAVRPGFEVSAPNYGQVPRDAANVLKGACPVVASYGARDRSLKNAAAKLDQALTAAGVEHDVKEYPDASHSFLTPYHGPVGALSRVTGMGLHAPSADDAWRRIDAFLDRHLKA